MINVLIERKIFAEELNRQGNTVDMTDDKEDFLILYNPLKLCDDFEFVKLIIVYIDLISVYCLQEQKYNNKPYDILNKSFMLMQTMIKYVLTIFALRLYGYAKNNINGDIKLLMIY